MIVPAFGATGLRPESELYATAAVNDVNAPNCKELRARFAALPAKKKLDVLVAVDESEERQLMIDRSPALPLMSASRAEHAAVLADVRMRAA